MEPSQKVNFSPRDRYPADLDEIHSPIHPTDIRTTDRVLARFRPRCAESDAAEFVPATVWKLSPLGVELVQPEDGPQLAKSDPIDLEIVIAGQRSRFEGLVVDVVESGESFSLLGIRLARRLDLTEVRSDRRGGVRWLCSDDFLPTCIAPNPGRFDDYVYFQVRDVSSEGFQLVCSLRNKFLISGTRLLLTVVFPMGRITSVHAEIARVGITSIGGRDRLVVGVRFVELSAASRQAIGQYLVQFGEVDSLDQLKAAGLAPESMSLGVDFYNLKSEEDYLSVLELRRLAHEHDGNLRAPVSDEEMGDINDARARIVVGKYRQRTIATARIRYNSLDEPLEHEEHVVWPKELPRRDQIIEVSRVATDPRFRKNDLLAALFRFICQNVVQPERPWLVISCLDRMIPFYTKMGFRPTGLRHTEPIWKEDRVLNVMIVNITELVLGRGVSPFYWNLVWKGLALSLVEQQAIVPSGMDKARMLLYRMLSPIAELALSLKRPSQKAR